MDDSSPPSRASRRTFTVPVRGIAEFVWRQGDLQGETDFVSPSRARKGIRGHQKIQRSRPAGYEKEVPVEAEHITDHFALRIRGRIDGVVRQPDRVWMEEIKTLSRPLRDGPSPLHWVQLKLYAALFLQTETCTVVDLQLTYLNLADDDICEYRQSFMPEELHRFYLDTISRYERWLSAQCSWEDLRDESIARLGFPHGQYRRGQRTLAVTVYRALRAGKGLFAEAPTGLGKTIAMLLPAVKALGEGRYEKIFYLTAKTVGRAAAEENLAVLRQTGLRLRSITLTSREKICVRDEPVCDPRICPRAKGYYDRLPDALRDALAEEILDRQKLTVLAENQQVCPFELSLDAALWVDVVIGDYNHAFDPRASLKRFFGEEARAYVLLVDEAHNLLERAREMFSADLDRAEWRGLRRALSSEAPSIARALESAGRAWTRWRASLQPSEATAESASQTIPVPRGGLLPEMTGAASAARTQTRLGGVIVARQLPEIILKAVRRFLGEAEEWLVQDKPAEFRLLLIESYFRALNFLRIADRFDERYLVLAERSKGIDRLRLLCLDPAIDLRDGIPEGSSGVFFSGTLTPLEFFRAALGGKEHDTLLRLDSPFPPEHLQVLLQDRIGTSWRERTGTFDRVTEAIAAFVEGHRGNYLVFFPSYDYLEEILARFRGCAPGVTLQHQRPNMTEDERRDYVSAFSKDRSETLVGFAILGGLFGESIDLIGERLTGAVIVGVGLPQVCLERDLIRHHFQEKGGAGFDYAYRFPGMNRVLQAAGRIIRSESDRGCLLLIDTRFAEAAYSRLLPRSWHPQKVRSALQIGQAVQRFWGQESESCRE
ncbi:MAG TPA: ATP-dependent DNA helicase [Candidatus Paceibacterota bacterium]|nr:ATP-dependent DNA helicase [Verrucomicrobiota bacterium]HRY51746.1 ATP-dependent DNA helicase [Candidatus Paceibacterota bacterium]HSA01971.1 ATP-dependent DNA helicase [Candidatus Paceibacterota bacterium]